MEKLLLRTNKWHRDHYDVRDLRTILRWSGPTVSLSDVERIKALRLDLLVSLSGQVPGDLLGATRLGAVSVQQDGFWACYHRRHQTRFVIRMLGWPAGRDDVLRSGAFRTRFFGSLNEANVRKKAVAHAKQILDKTAATGELPPPCGNSPGTDEAARAPNFSECLIYACKLASRIALTAPYHMPFFSERFGVTVIPGKWDEALPWKVVGGRLPRGRFWADPFVYARNGRTFCFIEDLDHRTGRGHITVLEIRGTELIELGVALREPFHLSFPFVFEHHGELYMCPESCSVREIRLYRCTEFPLGWRLERTLMREVSAADTMLFERDGRWWMLTNIDESETGDHCSELYLFSAASPLSTAWRPHPQNPLLVDSMGGRNGGLIVDGDRLFRIGQCQSFERYGKSVRVYEIKKLSQECYAEELVREMKPDFRKGVLGTHHLSTDGRVTVMDHTQGFFAA